MMENSKYTNDNNNLIMRFVDEYKDNPKPIEISFRNLFPDLNKNDRFTHLIHTYPAKLLGHIPFLFLNNTILSKPGDLVLDPFSGTGTVLLESILAGRNAIGADANPLARLIASVKVKQIKIELLNENLKDILIKAKNYSNAPVPNVINCHYWFSEKIITQLSKLFRGINEIENIDIKNFFLVSFSNCIKKVSFADPRISVPVKINPQRFSKTNPSNFKLKERLAELSDIDVFEKFKTICLDNINRMSKLNSVKKIGRAKITSDDARSLRVSLVSNRKLSKESVDLIITSPPYAGAQKYIRASSLSLGWLGMTEKQDLKTLDKKNIGSENYAKKEISLIKTGLRSADKFIEIVFEINPTRSFIVANYLKEMQLALDECIRVLKPNSYLVIIVGNTKVCTLEFDIQNYFSEYLKNKNLKIMFKLIDDIKSYGLMTKRNKTADIISREYILVFKKY